MTITVNRELPRHYSGTHFAFSQVREVLMPTTYQGSEADKQRGKDVHTMFQLEVHSITPEVAQPYEGYYASILHCVKTLCPTPIFCETPSMCANPHTPYGGTPDFYGWTELRDQRVLTLIEIKTGTPERWHPLQLMAYHKLELFKEAKRLLLVYLNAEGKEPKMVTVKHNARDWAAFVSALNLLVWRET